MKLSPFNVAQYTQVKPQLLQQSEKSHLKEKKLHLKQFTSHNYDLVLLHQKPLSLLHGTLTRTLNYA